MITNDGKEIIAKFLLGQVPSFATHLSIGCGATPLLGTDGYPSNLHAKQRMDFEMLRVPISSKGFVDASVTYTVTNKQISSNIAILTTSINHDIVAGEIIVVSGIDSVFNGEYRVSEVTANTVKYQRINTNVSSGATSGSIVVIRTKVSMTAEIVKENRYAATEIGIWSFENNTLASQYDSRMIFNFSQSWQKNDGLISSIPLFNTDLSLLANGTEHDAELDIQETSDVFFAKTSDTVFSNNLRQTRKEGPRYLDKTLMVRGDLSNIDISDGIDGDWVSSGACVELENINFDISGNNNSDILKLAFSLVDQTSTGIESVPDLRIMMEFYKTKANLSGNYAKVQIYIPKSVLTANRYHVSSWTKNQNVDYSNEAASSLLPYTRFRTSTDFNSSETRLCRIFVEAIADGVASDQHYVAFDGFRIDNTTDNPIYKMSGYSVVKYDGTPAIIAPNANNYVDFRFSLGIS
jgi:hypothetical protein